jgi:hypothetical protein
VKINSYCKAIPCKQVLLWVSNFVFTSRFFRLNFNFKLKIITNCSRLCVCFYRDHFSLKKFDLFTRGFAAQGMECIDLQEYCSSELKYFRGIFTAFSVTMFFPVWSQPFRLVDFPVRTLRNFWRISVLATQSLISENLGGSPRRIRWVEMHSSSIRR